MASTVCSDVSDGPVISVISKRIRALRKKHTRIIQMEESLSQGKTLNKEQEETLRSKPFVLTAIDELEKLKQPISLALSEEISSALQQNQLNIPATDSSSEAIEMSEVINGGEEQEKLAAAEAEPEAIEGNLTAVPDLLNLLYFGSMFDVKSQNDFTGTMLTRTHERGCCLTYDYVTDDDTADLLEERDLDMISMLGGLVISRAVDSRLSHKEALVRCVEHAKLWLDSSHQQIAPDCDITYAGLRQKLNKIMASEYFTKTPEMKDPAEVAKLRSFQVSGNSTVAPLDMPAHEEEYLQFEQKDAETAEGNGNYNNQSSAVGGIYQGEEGENHSEGQAEAVMQHAETEETSQDFEKGQQYVSKKPYQNYRGGRGGRRGYPNGRGGVRSSSRGGGSYNGRSQNYDNNGGYFPKNNYYRGRGGRGGGVNHNYQVGEGGYLVSN